MKQDKAYARLRKEMDFYTPDRMPKEKADKIFALAWDYGHANGLSDVKNYYMDIVEVARN